MRNLLLVVAVRCSAARWSSSDGALATLLGAAALVTAGVAWFESGPDSTRELAVVATLGSRGRAGRVLFSALPGVQPVTVVAVVAGARSACAPGSRPGRSRRSSRTCSSARGSGRHSRCSAGQRAAPSARCSPRCYGGASARRVCSVLGLLFSAIMDLWLWYGFFPHTTASLVAVLGRGLWFDLSHAIGNFVLALAIGPELRRMLERYRSRLHTEVVWA